MSQRRRDVRGLFVEDVNLGALCSRCDHPMSEHDRGRCLVLLRGISQCFCGDAASEASSRALHNRLTTGRSYLSREDVRP